MGKRMRGGRPSSAGDRFVLIRRIESCRKLEKLTVDEVVEYLRSNFPDYRRFKEQPFTKRVLQTLDYLHNKNISPSPNPNHDEEENTNSSRKKIRKSDSFHPRRNHKKQRPSESSSSSDSSSEQDEEDGAVSTSEDPKFDLMKSMIRSNYSASNSKSDKAVDKAVDKGAEVEKNLEIEDFDKGKKLELVDGGRIEGLGLGQGNGVEELKSGMKLKGGGGGGDRVGKGMSGGPRFSDLGGMKGVLDELMMEVIVPLFHPHLPRWLGVRPMAGILLHGPPGCGKTKLAHAIANETGVPFYKISATEVVSGVSGASEENIRVLFSKAYRTAPSIIFIDEIDAIASKRENLQREMERRIVTQLMTCMDESHQTLGSIDVDSDSETTEKKPGYVLVIGATNRPDAVDAALRRPGRFDREIVLGVPDEKGRVEILSVLTRNLRLEGTFDLGKIARSTPGFVGADLAALANKAGNLAMKRIIDSRKSELSRELNDEWWRHTWEREEMERLSITMADFEDAAKKVQPSSTREGFSAIPNVKWEDVGGLNLLRKEFDRYIVRRVKHPEVYEEFGVDLEAGFLLYGPPGCGKTLIAKAVANEAGANFIHIKGPELLNKYVGESELAVRTIFNRARTCSPCILFFDEVDALTTERGKDGGWVIERLLNQLLIELDGADHRRGVFVIGATNRFEVMDPAVLRPGRFGKRLYVPLPDPEERGLILKALARKKPLAADVDLDFIAQSKACENRSGADLAAVMNEAAMAALEEKQIAVGEGISSTNLLVIKTSHFEQALEKIPPSVSDEQRRYYERMSRRFKAV
ncbi:cell division cycle 48C [Tasmannia lanceolata]|uniref:cell division cycle 48C n=1 Tax=Tasmannia lanceolata TaxID=3420 RepID=UPI0040637274